MSPSIDTAMVLAAGLGRRMRHLSEQRPKPLTEVGGKALIDHVLDELDHAGTRRAVINVHYRADDVLAHLDRRRGRGPAITISDERLRLLDTGGALVKARPLLGAGAIFVANSDVVRYGGRRPAPLALRDAFDPTRMDVLLLLYPVERAIGFEGPGDFFLGRDGRLERRGHAERAPFLFAGLYVLALDAIAGITDEVFSANRLFDQAIARGRLFGILYDGDWMHVGSPEALAAAEQALIRP
ncbi:MAG: nucleotidyltransferase family protein [Alphaproteobacteria bacterium]|nr:nucleotidyltransferase family protein [Alphaproteobacteria bacterium]